MFPLYLFFIVISFFTGRKCVDIVVTFNKGREKTFAVSLQNRKSCICIIYLILVRPRKLIPVNFEFLYSMHRTPVLLKNYLFHTLVCFFSKKKFSPQKMFMSCLSLRHGTYLNSTSNVFAHLLIIFLGFDWFGFFLNK